MSNPKIGVVIPGHENSLLLKECVLSVLKNMEALTFTMIIVDNASTDPRVHALLDELETHREIVIIRNSENKGFSKAVNQGVFALTRACDGLDYFLVLNQDARLLDAKIAAALELMARNPGIGICGPRLHNDDGTIQNSFYAFPTPGKIISQLLGLKKIGARLSKIKNGPRLDLLPFFASQYLLNFRELRNPRDVPWITGACLIIRRQTYRDLSGFDENMWMYAEEMDFCLRAKLMGWRIVIFPNWHVLHHGEKTASSLSQSLAGVYYDSMAYVYDKHYRGVVKRVMLLLNKLERAKTVRAIKKGKTMS